MKTIRIFISSPGDVVDERERARQVIQQLRRRYAGQLEIKAVLWEELPLQVAMSFQAGIDLVLSDDHGIDIAVIVLWSRLGSPLGATIRKIDGSEYRSGTERELDLMLTAKRESKGGRPALLVYTRKDEVTFEERLRGKSTEEKVEILSQKKLVEQFIAEEFHDGGSGHNVRAYHTFDKPETFSQRLRLHLQELLDPETEVIERDPVWDIATDGSPFLGLESFQPRHAPVFFGREDDILEVRQALQRQARDGRAFIMIAGASGSGKSSLARAGVLPAIVENELDERVTGWRYLIITPGELGTDPFTAFAERLAEVIPDLRDGDDWAKNFGRDLRESAPVTLRQALLPALSKASIRTGGSLRLLLMVDQLEELISTSTWTAEEREDFANLLEALASSGRVWVLSTLRADFLGAVQQLPALVRLRSNGGQCDLLAPDVTELRRLITEPARMAELRFEVRDNLSLADVILADAAGHSELLPLISHLLADLFTHRSPQNVLTFERYETVGGVTGALAKHADQTLASPALADTVRSQLGHVLRLLVTVNGDDENTFVRQYPHLNEFSPEQRTLVDAFIAARLFTTRPDGTVTLAHESLLRVWLPARAWVEANADFLRVRARVESRLKQGSLLLEEDPLYPAAMRHFVQTSDGFTEDQKAYLAASKQNAEAVQLRKIRTRRLVMVSLSVLTVSSLAAGAWAIQKQAEAVTKQKEVQAKNQQLDASNQENEQLLNSASMASLVNGLKAWQDDRDAAAKGERIETTGGKSKWHEAVACFVRALELNSNNTRAADWLYTTLNLRWQEKRDWPEFTLSHDCATTSASYSPDGSKILTTDEKNQARIWDAATGRLLCGPFPSSSNTDARNFSADSTRFVTTAFHGTAMIRDTTSGEVVVKELAHGGPILQASFSADGKLLLTADVNGMLQVWDAVTGDPIGEPMKSGSPILSACFDPSGSKIATGGYDFLVRLWDTATGGLLYTLKAHQGEVQCVNFSPDGTKLVSTSQDRTARIWDVTTGKELMEPLRHELSIITANFSPDGTKIVTASADTTARIWDTATGKTIGEPMKHKMLVRTALFNNDGSKIVTASNDGRVRIWDGSTGSPAGETQHHALEVLTASFSPDGKHIVSSSKDQTAKIWQAGPTLPMAASKTPGHIASVSNFTPDGKTLVNVTAEGSVQILNTENQSVIASFSESGNKFNAAAISMNGAWVAIVDSNHLVTIWEVATSNKSDISIPHSTALEKLGLNETGTRLFTVTDDNQARLWDMKTGKIVGEPQSSVFSFSTVCFSPDGQALLTAGWDGDARLWNLETGEQIGADFKAGSPITHVAFSRDGSLFITSSINNLAQVWDVKTGAAIGAPLRHGAPASHGAFNLDGTRVVTTSWDGVTQIWDVASSKHHGPAMRHDSIVWCADFSPDGTKIVSGGSDTTVRIWDATTGRATGEAFPHEGMVNSVRFSSDGSKILSVCPDKSATVWQLPDEATREQIHNITPDVQKWANAVAGLKINDDGEIQLLPIKERQQGMQSLELPPGPWASLAGRVKATIMQPSATD